MKLIDILKERKEIPQENKVDISILKEFIFKDWQTFNQKVVPSFKTLRNRVIKENYNTRRAKNYISNIVEFAAKKYVAEHTNRKYVWNEVFSKNERLHLVNELTEFFEKYNLTETHELISEQGGITREAKITFSDIEIEIIENHPKIALNFNFDEATTNYITSIISKGQSIKISEKDLQLIASMLKVGIKDATSGNKLSYLKFFVEGRTIQRTDLKHLSGGAFLNRAVVLEVEGEAQPEQPETQENEPVEEPTQQQAPVSDEELKEIVNESIKVVLGKNFLK